MTEKTKPEDVFTDEPLAAEAPETPAVEVEVEVIEPGEKRGEFLYLLTPGDPGYDRIEQVRKAIDKLLSDSGVNVAEAISALGAALANGCIQCVPANPCALLPIVSDVIHRSIHAQLSMPSRDNESTGIH